MRRRGGYDLGPMWGIMMLFTVLMLGLGITKLLGSFGFSTQAQSSGIENSLRNLRDDIEQGCETGAPSIATTLPLRGIATITIKGDTTLKADLKGAEKAVTVDVRSCNKVVICKSSSGSGCTEGGELSGNEQLPLQITYVNDGKTAHIKRQ